MINSIGIGINIYGFLGSLITNPKLNLNWYLRFFGVADYESGIIFLKLKMTGLI